jgi:hypothetical protein
VVVVVVLVMVIVIVIAMVDDVIVIVAVIAVIIVVVAVAVDVSNFCNWIRLFNFSWIGILMLVISTGLLINELGWPAIIGISDINLPICYKLVRE